MVPGDPERRHRRQRQEAGIDIDELTWKEIAEAAHTVGLDL
jgi:LDH2 family malate/lactate/ureidoglycolate dehydrogenase